MFAMKKFLVALLLICVAPIPAFTSYATPATDTETPAAEAETPKKLSEEEIIMICKWYITTLPSLDPEITQLRLAASTAIIQFAAETKKFTIDFGKPIEKLFKIGSGDSTDLFGVYIAGEVLYLLEHNQSRNDAESFAAAMDDVMNFYTKLPKQSVKSLKKYLQMDSSERRAAFIKLYNDNK